MKKRVRKKSSSKRSSTFTGFFTVVVIIAILGVAGVGLTRLFHIPFAHSASYPELVNVATDGTPGNAASAVFSISQGGRYVVFESSATNLVPGVTSGNNEEYVRDRQTGSTELVNVATDGTIGNGSSGGGSISGDGRYVAFASSATNLVPGVTSGNGEVYVRDRQTGQTQLINVAPDGTPGDGISNSGFISGDGRYVAFESNSTNLVPGVTSGTYEIYIRDLQTGQTKLVSVAADGSEANAGGFALTVSADGRYIVYASNSTNLVAGVTSGTHVYLYDQQTGQTEVEDVSSQGVLANSNYNTYGERVLVSNDGRYVAFDSIATNLVPNDTNGNSDVFVRDRQTGTTIRVDVASDGSEAINEGLKPFGISMSGDGRYVAFASLASNLVDNDTNNLQDVFVHDMQTGQTKIVSLTTDGSQYTINCYKCNGFPFNTRETTISPDGNYVAFDSNGGNFIPGVNNSLLYNTYFTLNPFVSAVPVITLGDITPTPNPVQQNTSLSVSATYSDSAGGSSDTAQWNWGDNSSQTQGTESSGTVSGSHTYTALGAYTITLVVSNPSNGVSASTSAIVDVIPAGGFGSKPLKGTNYSGGNLSNQNLNGSNLMGATFVGTNFQNANLNGVNGKSDDFTNADFTSANLSNANFMGSNFTGANFTNATLLGSQFKNANMANVIYSNTICPNGTNSNNDGGTCTGQGGFL